MPKFLDNLLNAGAGAASGNPVASATAVMGILKDLFGNKPNPKDYKGWAIQDGNNVGNTVRGYVWDNGDNPDNEAVNILGWVNEYGINSLTSSGNPFTVEGQVWGDVTIEQIADKLQRGHIPQPQIQKFIEAFKPNSIQNIKSNAALLEVSLLQKVGNIFNPPSVLESTVKSNYIPSNNYNTQQATTKKSTFNILITLAFFVSLITLFYKNRNKLF
jgi:hypothetical protein